MTADIFGISAERRHTFETSGWAPPSMPRSGRHPCHPRGGAGADEQAGAHLFLRTPRMPGFMPAFIRACTCACTRGWGRFTKASATSPIIPGWIDTAATPAPAEVLISPVEQRWHRPPVCVCLGGAQSRHLKIRSISASPISIAISTMTRISRRWLVRVAIRSVTVSAASRMTASLRSTARARAGRSYSSTSFAQSRSSSGWSHNTSGFSSRSTREASRFWISSASPICSSIADFGPGGRRRLDRASPPAARSCRRPRQYAARRRQAPPKPPAPRQPAANGW